MTTSREADELGADELADHPLRDRFQDQHWECPECLEIVAIGRGCQRCADARGEPQPCERCGKLYGYGCDIGECLCHACESGDPCDFHNPEEHTSEVERCQRCDRELWSADDEPPLCWRCDRELPDERWELDSE